MGGMSRDYNGGMVTQLEAAQAIRDRAIVNDGCWGWIGTLDRDGYGVVKIRGKQYRAPRLSFFAANGYWATPIVRHTCDNRICCNPKHLLEGTLKQNARDASIRGRLSTEKTSDKWGEGRGRAKLSEAQVEEIKGLYATGLFTQKQLGERFNVHVTTVAKIVRGKSWVNRTAP
jgi:hypothetical protein